MRIDISKNLLVAFCLLSVIGIFLHVQICLAQGIVPVNDDGNYTVAQVLEILPRAMKFMLGISGSVALLAFVYGGVMFLISSGNREQVEKGKNIIKGAVIGLLLVFLSYTIIATIVTTMCETGDCQNWKEFDI